MVAKNFPKITIAGKSYPTRVSMGAMLRFTRETGKELSEALTFTDQITYLWCCVVSACSADGIEFGMDLLTFADHLDAEDVQAWSKAMEDANSADDENGDAGTAKKKH